MKDPFEAKRQTGRTTRMMLDVERRCVPGASIVVIVSSEDWAFELSHRFRKRFPQGAFDLILDSNGVKLSVNGATIWFMAHRNENWSWNDLRVRGFPEGTSIHIDHYAIESRFGGILAHWVRYDAEEQLEST